MLAKNARLTKTLDAVKMIQTERKRHIEEKCVAYQMTMGIVSRPLIERFLVDDEHGLLYCYIPKVKPEFNEFFQKSNGNIVVVDVDYGV